MPHRGGKICAPYSVDTSRSRASAAVIIVTTTARTGADRWRDRTARITSSQSSAGALADWVQSFGKRLTAIYITHGHADHWIGLSRLLERFPDARTLATGKVRERAVFEATNPGLSAYWQSIFPREVPAPAIQAVVGGDVVYNQVHMMTAETDEKGREDWISSLDQIAALQPQIVVSGHKRVGTADAPKTIGESQQYLRDFSRVVASEQTVEGIVSAMMELHPDRDNPRVVWHSAREAVKKRQEV